jgi:hypothetical protein
MHMEEIYVRGALEAVHGGEQYVVTGPQVKNR